MASKSFVFGVNSVYLYNVPCILDIDGDGQMEFFVEEKADGPWTNLKIFKLIDNKPVDIHSFGFGA